MITLSRAANTAAILVNCATGGAAFAAVAYRPEWYLPSVQEMLLLAQSNVLPAVYIDQKYWTSSEGKPTQPENFVFIVDSNAPQARLTSYENRTTRFYVRAIADF